MANIKFFYDNLWNEETLVPSTEHPHFLAVNTQHRDFNKPWRSMYGAESGWGLFVITVNVNDKVDFDEGGGEITATIPVGTYDADVLAGHIGAQMTVRSAAVGNTWTYVCTYDDATNKFTIEETSGPNNFTILWRTGTNGGSGASTGWTVGDTIGYDETADDNGANSSFEADNIRIHTDEYIRFIRAATIDVYGAFIRGHNFQAGITVYLVGSDDNFATWHFSAAFTIQDDILVLEYDTARTRQDWGIFINDVDNPAGFVEMGTIFLGPQFQPNRNFSPSRGIKPVDPSLEKVSEDGQIITLQYSKTKIRNYEFQATDQFAEFDAMFAAVGMSMPLFVVENPDTPLTTVRYIQFTDWNWTHRSGDFWDLTISYKELV